MPLAISPYNAPILHNDLLPLLQAEIISPQEKKGRGASVQIDQSGFSLAKIAALRRQCHEWSSCANGSDRRWSQMVSANLSLGSIFCK